MIVVYGFLSIMLMGCSSSKEAKVGFIIHSLSNVRWQTDLYYLNERAKEKNIQLLVREALDDENRQLEQARELLKEGIKVLIVVAVNQNTAAGIVRAAHEYNVPVISYDRFIMNSDLDYFVSFHYVDVGKLMVEHAYKAKPKGNYVFLWGESSDANAQFIKRGHLERLNELNLSNDIKIYHKAFIEDWSVANTTFEMTRLLEFGEEKIDAVIASNANLAKIAISTLEKYNQSEGVFVGAQDISLDTYSLILEGKQTMSVYKPMKELAYTAIDLADDLLKKKKVTVTATKNNGRIDVPAVLLEPSVVDRSNIREVVRKENLFKPEELEAVEQ